ncbi:hypothetical protein CEXT_474821 [Caerostris extrusa]|uniref:Uncharacterized protein n=1 Tax=Caerostris extrusa TaxID=172846 RepID=A0AAV4T754_CAEEX|nr:hypothetical protein CEXT_474821 [Caerostris extrusa]
MFCVLKYHLKSSQRESAESYRRMSSITQCPDNFLPAACCTALPDAGSVLKTHLAVNQLRLFLKENSVQPNPSDYRLRYSFETVTSRTIGGIRNMSFSTCHYSMEHE